MKYIKTFDTHSEYQTYSSSSEFITPNVSFCKDNTDEVHYNPYVEQYDKKYLTFEALEDGTFTLTIPSQIDTNGINSISYSVDNGKTWVTTENSSSAVTITTPTVTTGSKILWKGNSSYFALESGKETYNSQFSSTGEFSISGNIMSLIGGDKFVTTTAFESERALAYVFSNATKLKDASNLILPVETVSDYCYYQMFYGCTSLTAVPELPATTLAQRCYSSMFQGCTSLTTAPALPVITLASGCYAYMFSGCTSLTAVPTLPATTLADHCYQSMFYDCTALTTAPALPATTLEIGCYSGMFAGCTSLTTAPTTLPATTLARSCYNQMFNGCTSLTTAPELPATTLVKSCYRYMFRNCNNLNYIKAMFTTTPSTTYSENWVSGVAATGTFVKNSAATWDVIGVIGASGIPTGWTVETASE